jgi:hypothetical protein
MLLIALISNYLTYNLTQNTNSIKTCLENEQKFVILPSHIPNQKEKEKKIFIINYNIMVAI